MKNKLTLPLAFVALLFTADKSNAQTFDVSLNGNDFSKDTVAEFTLFTGRYVEGKTYLHWSVICQHTDGVYVIYSSTNGKDYEIVGCKQGTGVPISIPIAYYFQDEHQLEGTTYYKVFHISMNKTYMVSKKVAVTREGQVLSKVK